MKKIIAVVLVMGVINIALAADNIPRLQPTAAEWKQIQLSKHQKRSDLRPQALRQTVPKKQHGKKLHGSLVDGYISNQLFQNSDHPSRNSATVAGALIGPTIADKTNRSRLRKHKRIGSSRHGRHGHHRQRYRTGHFGHFKRHGYGYYKHKQYRHYRQGAMGFPKHRKFGHGSTHRSFRFPRH